MQSTVYILEIQMNTKAIQNADEIEINFTQFKKENTKFWPENCVIKFRSEK